MNLANYLSLIQAHMPGLKFHQVELDDTGWDNMVVIVNREWVFRFARTQNVAKRIQKEKRLLEYLHERLRHLDVSIPHYQLLRNQNQKVVGCYYKMIQGEVLKPTLLRRINDSAKARIAVQLGSFLSIVHSSHQQVIEDIGIEVVHTDQYWHDYLQEIRQHILPLLTPVEQTQVLNLFETYLQQRKTNCIPNTLVHGDLSHAHILYDPNKQAISGIIDFGDAQLTDPAYDFSGLYWDYGQGFMQEVLRHYTAYQYPDNNAMLFARVHRFFGKRVIFHDILHAIKQKDNNLLHQGLYALRKSLNKQTHF